MCAELRRYLLPIAILSLAGCGGGLTSHAPLPAIQSFTASEPKVLPGGETTLTAVFTGGKGVVTPLLGTVQSGAPVATGPLSMTTTFRLTVEGSQGVLREAQVTVGVLGFRATASMAQERFGHTATLLPDGRVLVAGGLDDGITPLASAELYDPTQGTFRPTGRMTAPRAFHTATLLASGKLLLVGGYGGEEVGDLSSAELFDPATGTFSPTGGLLYGVGLELHTASRLASGPHAGKVLIAGGFSSDLDEDNAVSQLYDPGTGRFTLHALMRHPRSGHDAVPLADGSLLFVGGYSTSEDMDLAATERYDPTRMAFVASGSLQVARYGAAVVPLADGRVLVAGGETDGEVHASTELYDPATTTFSAGPPLAGGRSMGQAALLPGGRVLLTGGFDPEDEVMGSAEIFDPRTGRMLPVLAGLPRAIGTVTSLKDGGLIFIGGFDGEQILKRAEVFQ